MNANKNQKITIYCESEAVSMKLKAIILSFTLFCGVLSFARAPKPAQARSAKASQAETSASAPQREDEMTKGLRADIARMESLVRQMDVNLSQVDASQSPLKHQFQLEIDAWRVMIGSMKRRLDERK
jgi:hypothetical protein